MKMRALLIAVPHLLLACSLFAQPVQKNGWQTLSLKGNVKELTETIISIEDTHSRRAINYMSEYKFNERGYITLDNRLPLKGGYGKALTSSKLYDSNNNLIKLSYEKYTATFQNKYDGNNHLISQTEYDTLMQIKSIDSFAYSDDGLLLEKMHYDMKDSLAERTIVTYDKKGIPTFKKYSKHGSLRHVTIYANNMSNNVVWECIYESDGSAYQTTECKYDSRGNCIMVHSFGKAQNIKEVIAFNEYDDRLKQTLIVLGPKKRFIESSYVYEYDERNNWISSIIYSGGVKLRTITRQITYY